MSMSSRIYLLGWWLLFLKTYGCQGMLHHAAGVYMCCLVLAVHLQVLPHQVMLFRFSSVDHWPTKYTLLQHNMFQCA